MFPMSYIGVPSLNILALYLPLSTHVGDFMGMILNIPSCPFRTLTSDLGFEDIIGRRQNVERMYAVR